MTGPTHSPARSFGTRQLALRLGATAALFIMLNLVFGLVLDRARMRCVNRESGVVNNARQAKADVLVLGSSRAKFHYDTDLLASLWKVSVYNAGQAGQAIPFNRVSYELIVANGYRPKVVIVDVMAFDEDMERVHALDPWYPEAKTLREMPSPEDAATGATVRPDPRIRFWMMFAAYRYADKTGVTLSDSPHMGEGPRFEAHPDGYDPARWKGTDRSAAGGKHPWFRPQLAALVDEVRATGATVVLAYSPMFEGRVSPELADGAASVAKEKSVPFVDFSETLPQLSADRSLFYDPEHLNASGAKAFTSALAKQIRPLVDKALFSGDALPAR